MMIGAAFILCFHLSWQVTGLIITTARCGIGYEWMFSSIGQSPCDVAAELAAVCFGGQFDLNPLVESGYVYTGPNQANRNSCRCSSVYYSLLSGCAYCQSRNYIQWSEYKTNCTTVYVTVYYQPIPIGVKVPAYAYQNVSVSDTFDVSLAQSMGGTESSRPPSTSTSTSATPSGSGRSQNTAAIVGGVVGGVAFLGILAVLIAFLIVRSRRKRRSPKHSSSFQQSPKMAFTPTTTATFVPPTISPPPGGPGTPGKVYDPNDPSTYPAANPNTTPSFPPWSPGSPGSSEERNDMSKYSPSMSSPYRENSPRYIFQTMTPNDTGVSARNSVPP